MKAAPRCGRSRTCSRVPLTRVSRANSCHRCGQRCSFPGRGPASCRTTASAGARLVSPDACRQPADGRESGPWTASVLRSPALPRRLAFLRQLPRSAARVRESTAGCAWRWRCPWRPQCADTRESRVGAVVLLGWSRGNARGAGARTRVQSARACRVGSERHDVDRLRPLPQ